MNYLYTELARLKSLADTVHELSPSERFLFDVLLRERDDPEDATVENPLDRNATPH